MKALLLVIIALFLTSSLGFSAEGVPLRKTNKKFPLYKEMLGTDDNLPVLDFFGDREILELVGKSKSRLVKTNYVNLMVVKKLLLKGNIQRAESILRLIDAKGTKLDIVKVRYQAIIHFIKNEYQETLRLLNHPGFNEDYAFRQICILKVTSMILSNRLFRFAEDARRCENIITDYSKNNTYWFTNLRLIKEGKLEMVKGGVYEDYQYIVQSREMLSLWLKFGLYLNAQSVIRLYIDGLPEFAYRSEKIRELIGLYHYRNSDFTQALSFIENIDSANTENIKGNISLRNGQLELAFGHFKLALKYKENSQNAIQRGLPLSWLLGKWDDGLDLLSRVRDDEFDLKKMKALEIAFRIRKEEYKQVEDEINVVSTYYRGDLPLHMEMMKSFTAFIDPKNPNFIESIEKNCYQHEPISCWMLSQDFFRSNSRKELNQKRQLPMQKFHFTVNALKAGEEAKDLNQAVFIDQEDIQALDDESFKSFEQ